MAEAPPTRVYRYRVLPVDWIAYPLSLACLMLADGAAVWRWRDYSRKFVVAERFGFHGLFWPVSRLVLLTLLFALLVALFNAFVRCFLRARHASLAVEPEGLLWTGWRGQRQRLAWEDLAGVEASARRPARALWLLAAGRKVRVSPEVRGREELLADLVASARLRGAPAAKGRRLFTRTGEPLARGKAGKVPWWPLPAVGYSWWSTTGWRLGLPLLLLGVPCALTVRLVGIARVHALQGTVKYRLSEVAAVPFEDADYVASFVWNPQSSAVAGYACMKVPGKRHKGDPYPLHIVCATPQGEAWYLTSGWADDSSPSWSPDGKQVAFLRYKPGEGERLALRAADGAGPVRVLRKLEKSCPYAGWAAWSPTGESIAVLDEDEKDAPVVKLVAPEGDGSGALTLRLPAPVLPYVMAWSPGGEWLATVAQWGDSYTSSDARAPEVGVLGVADGQWHRLQENWYAGLLMDSHISWQASPARLLLQFPLRRSWQVYSMDVATGEIQILYSTLLPGRAYLGCDYCARTGLAVGIMAHVPGPSAQMGGDHLAIAGERGFQQLPFSRGGDYSNPGWSPDGRYLAVIRNQNQLVFLRVDQMRVKHRLRQEVFNG